ncbi:MAG: tetratricopeptide repeat protein [Ahrensia sp.]|nr:tetratricopeptide repeat protein [Ahrensia sp.]
MSVDIFRQSVSLKNPKALQAWNKTQLAFLAHGASTPTHLAKTLEAAPDFALGHTVKAMFYLLLGRRELMETASQAHQAALRAAQAQTISRREQQILDALTVWMQGFPSKALAHFETVLNDHPQDTLTMKLDHAVRFVLGDAAGMRRMVEKVLPSYDNAHPGFGYLLGCQAFALEETGDYSAAGVAGRKALLLAPDDAWGLHAVAHVHDMTADAKGGLDWLKGRENAWAHCNNFRYHVWWHKALMHLDLGQYDQAMALYDTEIRADRTDDYRDISNATSLLSRLELDGIDVGNRWEELADLCAERTEDGCLIFADLHYLLALVGDDRKEAKTRLIQRLHSDASESKSDMQRAMATPGLSAAIGLEAFGDGNYEKAFVNLTRARPNMCDAGGSHAQRDVFERLTIDCGIRAGFLDEASAMLSARTAKRAGREDGYAAARRDLISVMRHPTNCVSKVPAV